MVPMRRYQPFQICHYQVWFQPLISSWLWLWILSVASPEILLSQLESDFLWISIHYWKAFIGARCSVPMRGCTVFGTYAVMIPQLLRNELDMFSCLFVFLCRELIHVMSASLSWLINKSFEQHFTPGSNSSCFNSVEKILTYWDNAQLHIMTWKVYEMTLRDFAEIV